MELPEEEFATTQEIQRGAFKRFYPALSRYSKEEGTNQERFGIDIDNLPQELQSSKELWNAHGMAFADYLQIYIKTRFYADRPSFLRNELRSMPAPVEHKARLRHRLEEFALKRAFEIPQDASSQFSAISHQLFGVIDKANSLRKIAARWLRENRHYEISGTKLLSYVESIRWDTYCQQVENLEFGGDLFTLVALAEKFGIFPQFFYQFP